MLLTAHYCSAQIFAGKQFRLFFFFFLFRRRFLLYTHRRTHTIYLHSSRSWIQETWAKERAERRIIPFTIQFPRSPIHSFAQAVLQVFFFTFSDGTRNFSLSPALSHSRVSYSNSYYGELLPSNNNIFYFMLTILASPASKRSLHTSRRERERKRVFACKSARVWGICFQNYEICASHGIPKRCGSSTCW